MTAARALSHCLFNGRKRGEPVAPCPGVKESKTSLLECTRSVQAIPSVTIRECVCITFADQPRLQILENCRCTLSKKAHQALRRRTPLEHYSRCTQDAASIQSASELRELISGKKPSGSNAEGVPAGEEDGGEIVYGQNERLRRVGRHSFEPARGNLVDDDDVSHDATWR